MGHNHEHSNEETPEELAAREKQRLAMQAQTKPEDQGILSSIMGFLKFLFEMFFPSQDAPNEEASAVPQKPETTADRLRLGQLIIEKKAIPKWEKFQGEHKNDAVNFASPVVGASVVTSGFGHRHAPTAKASTNHAGVDLGARGGVASPDIAASESGIILFAGHKQGYGNTVIIGHANGSYTLYGHMHGTKMPEIGSEVKRGEVIGVMGATGTATGVHLHYEQRKGTEALQPKIAGVVLHEGVALASAKAPNSKDFSALINPNTLPKLPSQHGGTPVALATNALPVAIQGHQP